MKGAPNRVTVIIRNSNCKVVQMLLSRDIEGSFKNIRVGDKISSHLIHLSKKANSRDLRLEDVTVYRLGKSFLWVDSPSCNACQTLSNNAAIPVTVMFLKGLGVVFSFLTPGPIASKKVVAEMRQRGLDVDVLSRGLFDLRQTLTKRQRDALYTAFAMGYFSQSRETNLAKVAEKMGLSKSTVSRHLRAAIRKLASLTPAETV